VAFLWSREDFVVADTSVFRPSIAHHHELSTAALSLPWQALGARRAARRLAERIRPELVHGFYLSSNGLVAAATGVHPLVLSALGSDVLDLSRNAKGPLIGRLVNANRVRLTRAAVASADAVLTDSTALADAIHRRVPGTPTRIVRFGVELAASAGQSGRSKWRRLLAIEADAYVLLSSRLIRPQYNIDTAISALPLIRSQLPNSILILKELESFSDPEYRRHCLDLVDKLNLRDAVRIVGELDREDLLELNRAADIYISIPATDGTSVSVLEAMASGVAVVAGDVPGIDPAILRHDVTALLIRQLNPESLASAVISLGLDPDRRRDFVARAQEVVRLHGDFDRELDRAVCLYEELARSTRRSADV
jgi:glycosyltransferase involved in cell wall biosynthesis